MGFITYAVTYQQLVNDKSYLCVACGQESNWIWQQAFLCVNCGAFAHADTCVHRVPRRGYVCDDCMPENLG